MPPLLKTVTQSWLSGCWAVSGLRHRFSHWLDLWAVQMADPNRDWGTPHLYWNLGKLQCSYNWTTLTTVKCLSLGLCKRRLWKSLLLPSGTADRVLTLPRNGSQMVSQLHSLLIVTSLKKAIHQIHKQPTGGTDFITWNSTWKNTVWVNFPQKRKIVWSWEIRCRVRESVREQKRVGCVTECWLTTDWLTDWLTVESLSD